MKPKELWNEIQPMIPSFSAATLSGTGAYMGARFMQDSFHIVHAYPSIPPEMVTSMVATLIGLFTFAVVELFTTKPPQ